MALCWTWVETTGWRPMPFAEPWLTEMADVYGRAVTVLSPGATLTTSRNGNMAVQQIERTSDFCAGTTTE